MSKSKSITKNIPLQPYFDITNKYEIGIDECARGPLFGRLYVAATILPKDDSFCHSEMKDSKKIHSIKKMRELSDYIKQHAISWHIHYIEHDVIDHINIRQAVLQGMRECVKQILLKMGSGVNDYGNIHRCSFETARRSNEQLSYRQRFEKTPQRGVPFQMFGGINDYFIVVDGNDFLPYIYFNETENELITMPHITVEKGDNTYSFIAAASILAKNAHDEYILELCEKYPELKTRYFLHENVGYGTKKHLDGIREHGITQWHRKSFGICKNAPYSPIICP